MKINRKKTNTQKITKLFYKNKFYTDKASIAHQLNTHYINVGRNLDEKLPLKDTYQTPPMWKRHLFSSGPDRPLSSNFNMECGKQMWK